jgi:hypothetical protein
MPGRVTSWFVVIVLAGVGVFVAVLAGQELVTMTSASTTHEGEVVSRDRREERRVDSEGRTTTVTVHRTVVRYAGGTADIGASEVYDHLRQGDRVRVDISDRTGAAVAVRAGQFEWRRSSGLLVAVLLAVALLLLGVAAYLARMIRRVAASIASSRAG